MVFLSCKKLSDSYRIGTIIVMALTIFFVPVYTFPISYYVAIAAGALFLIFYSFDDNEEKVYYKQYCFYLVLIQYLIIAISLYQIIFGDPANWLGTGIDLTMLPKV